MVLTPLAQSLSFPFFSVLFVTRMLLFFSFLYGEGMGAPRCYNPLDCDARLLRARGVCKALRAMNLGGPTVGAQGALYCGPGSQYLYARGGDVEEDK
jgi:hypothetical protein